LLVNKVKVLLKSMMKGLCCQCCWNVIRYYILCHNQIL
jgi:hypothetical protein